MLNWNTLLSHKRLEIEEDYNISQEIARSQFQRDYDRIIFSSPFRRLQNKTQVFPLPGSVFVHNRLTHSLEVASVGRSFGNLLANGLIERKVDLPQSTLFSIGSIISSACLAHDLGNPPFGHSGEKAISRYFKEIDNNNLSSFLSAEQHEDFLNFEGNANAFRLLTHQFNGRRKGGFALTYATLGTLLKYPCTSTDLKTQNSPYEKYGVFNTEKNIFESVAKELGLKKIGSLGNVYGRHPLVFLMEAADDICYQIVDIEDAHRLNILSSQQTKDLLFSFFDPIQDKEALEKLEKALEHVQDENEQIVILRSRTINKLIDDYMQVFWEHYDQIMNSTFFTPLSKKLEGASKIALHDVSSIANKKIYNAREVIEIQVAGHRILSELLDEFVTATLNNNSLYTQQLLQLIPSQLTSNTTNKYDQLFSVLDYISGMTDVYALEIYRKIKGISFSVIR